MDLNLETLYWYTIIFGCSIGFILNVILIYFSYISRHRIKSCAYLILATAILDALSAFDGLYLQHEFFIYNGRLIFYSNGLDLYVNENIRLVMFTIHIYLIVQNIYFLGAQAHFRCKSINNPTNAIIMLVRNGIVISFVSIFSVILFLRALDNGNICKELEKVIVTSSSCIYASKEWVSIFVF